MVVKKHPYSNLENTKLWLSIEKAIQSLTDNNDLKLQTDRSYIVGFLAKSLSDSGLIKNKIKK